MIRVNYDEVPKYQYLISMNIHTDTWILLMILMTIPEDRDTNTRSIQGDSQEYQKTLYRFLPIPDILPIPIPKVNRIPTLTDTLILLTPVLEFLTNRDTHTRRCRY